VGRTRLRVAYILPSINTTEHILHFCVVYCLQQREEKWNYKAKQRYNPEEDGFNVHDSRDSLLCFDPPGNRRQKISTCLPAPLSVQIHLTLQASKANFSKPSLSISVCKDNCKEAELCAILWRNTQAVR
jgi:hypothetical protein